MALSVMGIGVWQPSTELPVFAKSQAFSGLEEVTP
jgi:hypothetical protein